MKKVIMITPIEHKFGWIRANCNGPNCREKFGPNGSNKEHKGERRDPVIQSPRSHKSQVTTHDQTNPSAASRRFQPTRQHGAAAAAV